MFALISVLCDQHDDSSCRWLQYPLMQTLLARRWCNQQAVQGFVAAASAYCLPASRATQDTAVGAVGARSTSNPVCVCSNTD